MKKIIPLVAIVVAVGYFVWAKGQSAKQNSDVELKKPQSAASKVAPKTKSLQQEEVVPIEEDESLQREEERPLWVESDLAREVLKENGRLPVDLNGETYLELDVEMLNNLTIGDYVDIDLPGIEGSYDAQVGGVEDHASGNTSLQLNFPGLTRLHGATFTLGANSTYAQLNLPSGSYTLEAQGGYAWIAPNGALIKNHVEKHDQDMSSEASRDKNWSDKDVPLNDFD
ncbi:DLW-39 family protein [Microbulbifer sp. OS29]|uniref:DLW-39 family protein n=1 Tax=Microbulbifer okhotskensis TaxID=2926617 RepID=A0A9X2J7T9_9GAMM|nr:DLW-39 family protein [Microbulbifer okhotskensis]MCO1336135.1 DLW-39 family protein [Microbulbifer okhotskensis]